MPFFLPSGACEFDDSGGTIASRITVRFEGNHESDATKSHVKLHC